jgi:hypothetical protein
MTDETPPAAPPVPKAFLIVNLSVFVPRADNPTQGDHASAQPIEIPLFPVDKPEDAGDFPDAFMVQIEQVLGQLAVLGRKHTPKRIIAPEMPKIDLGNGGKAKGPMTMQPFLLGPQGQQIPLGPAQPVMPEKGKRQ